MKNLFLRHAVLAAIFCFIAVMPARAEEPPNVQLTAEQMEQVKFVAGQMRHWPRQKKMIRLGYRIIGTIERVVDKYLGSKSTIWDQQGPFAYFTGSPYDILKDIDIEHLLVRKIASFSSLTGLSINAERIPSTASAEEIGAEHYDITIDLYLDDIFNRKTKKNRIVPFYGLQTMHRSLGLNSDYRQSFIPPIGISTQFIDTRLNGAACLLVYTPVHFWIEIGDGLLLDVQQEAERPYSRYEQSAGPFENMFRFAWGGWKQNYEYLLKFNKMMVMRNVEPEPIQDNQVCRASLRQAYITRWQQGIESCLAASVGVPLEPIGMQIAQTMNKLLTDVGIAEDSIINPERREARFIDPFWRGTKFEEIYRRKLGSDMWVGFVGSKLSRLRYETKYFGTVSRHFESLLEAIYKPGELKSKKSFLIALKRAFEVAANKEQHWPNLFNEVSQCYRFKKFPGGK